jgi:hypothetical protein
VYRQFDDILIFGEIEKFDEKLDVDGGAVRRLPGRQRSNAAYTTRRRDVAVHIRVPHRTVGLPHDPRWPTLVR